MAVAGVVSFGQFLHGNDAAVGFTAAGVLELNGGMRDVKVLFEQVVEPG